MSIERTDTLAVTSGGSADTLAVTSGGSVTAADATPTVSGAASSQQLVSALTVSGFTYTGAGIKVGVLSTSFNNSGGAAMDMADGTLPPASQVSVLQDAASTDEGRALMQIVHQIAPGASLMFYTGINGAQDFANGILALQQAGCNVIVDDVDDQPTDPMFQLDVVGEAVQQVISAGVIYVAAAGDSGSAGYQAPWQTLPGTFSVPTTAGGSQTLTNLENFGGSPFLPITVTGSGGIHFSVAWDQPFTGPQSTMELFVLSGGNILADKTTTNFTSAGITYSLLSGGDLPTGSYDIAVEKLSGPDPGLLKVILGHTPLLIGSGSISGGNAGTIQGHTLTSGVIVTGAANWTTTPAFFAGGTMNQDFSASGVGTELLYGQNGNSLAPPQVLSPVGITGVDGMATTVFPHFFGTSAAAPTIAGIVALMLQANPKLTSQQANEILQATASAMPNPAVAGAGLAVASAAIAAALATQTVSGGQILNVANWTTDAVIVSSGGELNVLSRGIANAATINSGGSGLVSAGGVVSGARVSAGGMLEILSSGIASSTTVTPSGLLEVGSGGSAVGTTLYGMAGWLPASGGSAGPGADYVPVTIEGSTFVSSGGSISNTTVSSGGLLVLAGGALVGGTMLSGGMEEFVSGYASANFGVSSGQIYLAGTGGAFLTATISSGGSGLIGSGGTATSTTVSGGGLLEVLSGGTVVNTSVTSGGTLE